MKNQLDINLFKGLTDVEVGEHLKTEGYNELPSSKKRSIFTTAFEVACQPMFLLLVAGGLLYWWLGDLREALMLLGFVFVVMGITLYQERKTERALEALRDLSSPRALVIRNGVEKRIAGRELVSGDILIVNEGDRVAAENFLQHADHYYRVVASMNEGQRPRIGGREVSVADINVNNGSQGLSAALSGHGHSGAGDDNAADNQQSGNGNGNNGQARAAQHQDGRESDNRASSEADAGQSPNVSQDRQGGNSDGSAQFEAGDEQPEYPEELLPSGGAATAPRDGQADGRQQGRMGRGRRRGPGRRVRNDGEETPPPVPPADADGNQ